MGCICTVTYNDMIEDYLQQRICEDIPKTKHTFESEHSNVEYYLSHHAVIKKDKETTKLRVVLDAVSYESRPPKHPSEI